MNTYNFKKEHLIGFDPTLTRLDETNTYLEMSILEEFLKKNRINEKKLKSAINGLYGEMHVFRGNRLKIYTVKTLTGSSVYALMDNELQDITRQLKDRFNM